MIRRASLSFLLALFASVLIADVPSRPATPRELAAIQKAVHAVDGTFDRFADTNWGQKSASKHEHFDVAKEPGRPINFAMQCDREFAIKPGSPLFNTKVKPIYDELTKTKDMSKARALGQQLDGKTEFSVEARANVLATGGSAADYAHDLGAKGAAFSFCERGPQLDCYVVLGEKSRWKPAPSGRRDFGFAHPKGTPFVENLTIHFHAKSPTGMAADRVHELIRGTDWAPVAASLE